MHGLFDHCLPDLLAELRWRCCFDRVIRQIKTFRQSYLWIHGVRIGTQLKVGEQMLYIQVSPRYYFLVVKQLNIKVVALDCIVTEEKRRAYWFGEYLYGKDIKWSETKLVTHFQPLSIITYYRPQCAIRCFIDFHDQN